MSACSVLTLVDVKNAKRSSFRSGLHLLSDRMLRPWSGKSETATAGRAGRRALVGAGTPQTRIRRMSASAAGDDGRRRNVAVNERVRTAIGGETRSGPRYDVAALRSGVGAAHDLDPDLAALTSESSLSLRRRHLLLLSQRRTTTGQRLARNLRWSSKSPAVSSAKRKYQLSPRSTG